MKPMGIETAADHEGSKSKKYWKAFAILATAFVLAYAVGISSNDTSNQSGNNNPDQSGGTNTQITPTESGATVSTPPPTPKPVSEFPTREQLLELRKTSLETRAMLEEYYEGSEKPALALAWGYPKDSKQWKDMVEYQSINLAMVIANQRTYKAGMIGSSVGAGHDNCKYDAFEGQLERFMDPILKIAGSGMYVHNAGEGGGCGDDQRNQAYCWKNLVGDVDLLLYSWSYFETGGNRPHATRESLIRWARASKNSPPVLSLNMFRFPNNQCWVSWWHKKNNLKTNEPIVEYEYSKWGYNAFCLHSALVNLDSERNKGKKWGHVGDGLHNTTRYAYTSGARNGTRQESLGVVWRNWHPGPLGFQLAVDNFAYNLLEATLLAVDKLLAAKDAGKDLRVEFPDDPESPELSEMGKPIAECDTYSPPCTEGIPPMCSTYELPQFGSKQIWIAEPDDDLNPFRLKDGETGAAWKFGHYGFTQLVPRQEKKFPECAHKDACGYLQGTPESAPLSIKMPKVPIGGLIVCFLGIKKRQQKQFIESPNFHFIFEDQIIPKKFGRLNDKCFRVFKRYPENMNDPTGHAYVGLVMNGTVEGRNVLQVSQIIAY